MSNFEQKIPTEKWVTHTHSPEFIPPRPSLRSWLGGSCCCGEVRWRCSPDVTDVTSAQQVSADLHCSELFQVQTRSDPGPTLRSGPLRPGPRTRKYGSGPPSHRTEPRTHRFGSVRTSIRRGPDRTVDSVTLTTLENEQLRFRWWLGSGKCY